MAHKKILVISPTSINGCCAYLCSNISNINTTSWKCILSWISGSCLIFQLLILLLMPSHQLVSALPTEQPTLKHYDIWNITAEAIETNTQNNDISVATAKEPLMTRVDDEQLVFIEDNVFRDVINDDLHYNDNDNYDDDDDDHDWRNVTNANDDEKQKRQSKVIHLFPVPVDGECISDDGRRSGSCFNVYECHKKGGLAKGECAMGFGVCCIFIANCNETISNNITYLVSPNFPSFMSNNFSSCSVKIKLLNAEVSQLRIDFYHFSLGQPNRTNGNCDGDIFNIKGGPSGTFSLCGQNSGQHIYYDVGTRSLPRQTLYGNIRPLTLDDIYPNRNNATISNEIEIVMNFSKRFLPIRLWEIRVAQIPFSQRAPAGCLQFHTGAEGVIQTFNFAENGRHLANQHYRICIRQETGMCSIMYQPCDEHSFRIGPGMRMTGGMMGGMIGGGGSGSNMMGAGAVGGAMMGVNMGNMMMLMSNGTTMPLINMMQMSTMSGPPTASTTPAPNAVTTTSTGMRSSTSSIMMMMMMMMNSTANAMPASTTAAAAAAGSTTAAPATTTASTTTVATRATTTATAAASTTAAATTAAAATTTPATTSTTTTTTSPLSDDIEGSGDISDDGDVGAPGSAAVTRRPRPNRGGFDLLSFLRNAFDLTFRNRRHYDRIREQRQLFSSCTDRITMPCIVEDFIGAGTGFGVLPGCEPIHCGSNFCTSGVWPCRIESTVTPFYMSVHFGNGIGKGSAEDNIGACLRYDQVKCI